MAYGFLCLVVAYAHRDATVGLALGSYEEEEFEGKSVSHTSIGWWERERLEEWVRCSFSLSSIAYVIHQYWRTDVSFG